MRSSHPRRSPSSKRVAEFVSNDLFKLDKLGGFAPFVLYQLAQTLYLHVGLDSSDWLTDFQSETDQESNEDFKKLKALFQYSEDPRDPEATQLVGLHKFVKEANKLIKQARDNQAAYKK